MNDDCYADIPRDAWRDWAKAMEPPEPKYNSLLNLLGGRYNYLSQIQQAANLSNLYKFASPMVYQGACPNCGYILLPPYHIHSGIGSIVSGIFSY